MKILTALLFLFPSVALNQCTCPCECPPNGEKLRDLINCFATWGESVATGPNSQLRGANDSEVFYCKTTSIRGAFCKFDGTNNLVESDTTPDFYFNCGMRTCDAWLVGHTSREKACIASLFKDSE